MRYKKSFTLIALSFFYTISLIGEDKSQKPQKKESFKEKYKIEVVAAPMVSSNPNFGNSIGATVVTLFDINKENENIPSSTLVLSGTYSDRDSHFLGTFANIFPTEMWRIKLGLIDGSIKSELNIDEFVEQVKYTTDLGVIFTDVQYKFSDNMYAGVRALVLDKSYTPDNQAGEDFLLASGAEDVTSFSLGPILSYDSRDNQFFPYSGIYSELSWLAKPNSWGNETDYYITEGFLNGYKQIKQGHVIAGRLYGRFAPDDTPFSDLSTLGRRSDLRGYIAGEETAHNLISAQVEYRWNFKKRWAIVGFVGQSALFDNGDLNSDSLYTSGGGGLRFMASEERRMNFRMDYAVGQGSSDGFYIGFGEAF